MMENFSTANMIGFSIFVVIIIILFKSRSSMSFHKCFSVERLQINLIKSLTHFQTFCMNKID